MDERTLAHFWEFSSSAGTDDDNVTGLHPICSAQPRTQLFGPASVRSTCRLALYGPAGTRIRADMT
jgi:hypothetical protein